jgi:hypothetical protein
MRAFSATVFAVAGVVLCAGAVAQDRDGLRTPRALAPSVTTGAASSEAATPAPIGHRQPRSGSVPNSETNGAAVSPYDQEIDRSLDICRGC